MPDHSVNVVGVHPISVTDELFRETLQIQWGDDLSGEQLAEAEAHVKEHYASLYLIEIDLGVASRDFDWSEVTQEELGQPRSNWQVPYDEQALGEQQSRWAFFFHYLDLSKPLLTPCGPVKLPGPTPIPRHLEHVAYETP